MNDITNRSLIDLLHEKYSEICDELIKLNRDVLECEGRIMYRLYIWSDGEFCRMQEAQGSNAFLVPRDGETRSLYHIHTVEYPCFYWKDFCDVRVPHREEDPEMYDRLRDETIDYLVSDYDPEPILDNIIAEEERSIRYAE